MAMRMKTCLFCAVLALAAVGFTAARAEEFGAYRLEAGLHLEFQSDTVLAANPSTDASLADVRARWHFGELSSDEPVEECAFLARVPYAGLRLGKLSVGGFGVEFDGLLVGLEGRYAAENVPVAASLLYRWGTLEDAGTELDVSEFNVRVGYWAQSNLEVGGFYGTVDLGLLASETSEAGFGAYVKTVREIRGRKVNLEGEIGGVTYDDGAAEEANFKIAVGCDCYLSEGLSLGGAIVSNSGDYADAEGLGFEARITYNHGTALGMRLAVGRFEASAAGAEDTTAGTILVVYRR